MKKILLYLVTILLLVIAGFFIFVQSTWNKKHEAPYPDIKASTDSAVIARGKYLVFGPAHCAECHGDMNKMKELAAGEIIPLCGGWELPIDPGIMRARNITPDVETGIGKLTDGEIARTMRYSVGSDGRTIFPFMPFQNMSDEDLTAIISFLRSQPAVKNKIEPSALNFLGKAIQAVGMIQPIFPEGTPPKTVKIDSTIEYGSYIANSVANCKGCHTDRDLKTGKFIGEPFAGGFHMPPDAFSKGFAFITPNLTPDVETSRLKDWAEQAFINRFRQGRIYETSPMPWGPFSRLDEVELKALYRYLQSIPAVKNSVVKTVFAPGEALPK